jgi:hypothetical protein
VLIYSTHQAKSGIEAFVFLNLSPIVLSASLERTFYFTKEISPTMRRTLLLFALIMTASSLAMGQTNSRHIVYIQNGNSGAAAQCRGDQLSARSIPDSLDAAMGGVRSMDFAFKNTSTTPCTLKGYPRFELLNRSGRPARHGRAVNNARMVSDDGEDQTPQLVTLAPGKTAWFRFHFNTGGAGYVGKPCPTFPKIKITAPGTKRDFILREGIQSCSELEVSAVQSGKPR